MIIINKLYKSSKKVYKYHKLLIIYKNDKLIINK